MLRFLAAPPHSDSDGLTELSDKPLTTLQAYKNEKNITQNIKLQ
jgi:hypothetical protein